MRNLEFLDSPDMLESMIKVNLRLLPNEEEEI